MRVVTDKLLQTAIDALEGKDATEICLRAGLRRNELEEAKAEAVACQGGSAAEDRTARARLDPEVRRLSRETAIAEAEERGMIFDIRKAELMGRIFQTENRNQREGII